MIKLNNVHFFMVLLFLGIFSVQAQQKSRISVTGTVLNSLDNEPLAGVNVRTGEYSSVLTNQEGKFTIRVPNESVTLVVSSNDFKDKEVALKGRNDILIKIHPSDFNSYYGDVNMVFGKKAKSSVVSAIESKSTKIETSRESISNVMNGEIAGTRAIMRSGVPGIGANIFIRGYNSINSSTQPLIIVDGMIIESNTFSNNNAISGYSYDPLTSINPKDIANITVIKDAASTYGSRAANGVILIETNKTDEITTKIDLFAQGGFNIAPTNIPMLGSNGFRSYLSEQISNSGGNLSDFDFLNENKSFQDYDKYHNNTNWQDEVFEESYASEYYFKVTGGDEVAKFGLSVGYTSNQGVVSNSKFNRFTTRFNADTNISDKLTLNTNLSVGYTERDLFDDGIVSDNSANNYSPIIAALEKAPFLAPFVTSELGVLTPEYEDVDDITDINNINGIYAGITEDVPSGYSNPKAIVDNASFNARDYNLFGQFDLGYKLSDDLKFSSLAGVNYLKNRQQIVLPSLGLALNVFDGENFDFVTARTNKVSVENLLAFYNDTKLNYKLNLNNINDFNFNLGFRYNQNSYQISETIQGGSSDDSFTALGDGSINTTLTGGNIGNWKYASTYANIDYALLNKYYVSLNASADSSSRYGDNVNIGVFPSIAGAWLVSSEDFMNSSNAIDLFKLRASYGLTGNEAIGNYVSQSYFESIRFISGSGLVNGNIANTAIGWEQTKKANLGLDLGLFNERLSFNVDYFNNVTDNLINEKSISPVYGKSNYLTNSGSLKNTGYELSFNARVINTRNFKWDLGGNISNYKNEITSIEGGQQILDNHLGLGESILNKEGSAIGLFYGYQTDGIFNNSSEATQANLTWEDAQGLPQSFEAGDVKFFDHNDDGKIDESDRVVIGDPNPDFTGMFYNNFTYKGFSLSAVFTFSKGNDIYNALRSNTESMSDFSNQSLATENRWRVENQDTNIPRAVLGDPAGNSRFSDRWIEDGSYLRLKTLSLSFTPETFNSTFYVTANNLLTFTKYLGYDPEVSASQLSYLQGIDGGYTPQYRSVALGVRIGL